MIETSELIPFAGATMDVAGKLLIAYTAIRVHHRVQQEHRIDKKVFKAMKQEQRLAVMGALLILAGYTFEHVFRLVT